MKTRTLRQTIAQPTPDGQETSEQRAARNKLRARRKTERQKRQAGRR